jgi:phosphoglycolate phosphatase
MAARTAVFDLDGTLIDSFEGITRCYQHALERMGCRVPPQDELRSCIGPPIRGNFPRLLGGDDPARVERGVALYRERYDAVGWRECAVYPGVEDMLRDLRARGLRLLVATAKPQVYTDRILAHLRLAPLFERAFGTTLDGALDDKRRLLAHAIGEAPLEPAGTAMVGDRANDVVAARTHALRPIGVLWGYGSREELVDAGAEVVCATPGDVVRSLADAPRSRRGDAPGGGA